MTLTIMSRSSNLVNSFPLPTMYLCKFGQNAITGSEDNSRKRSYIDASTDADRIHSKTILSPLGLGVGGLNIYLLKSKPEVFAHDIFSYKFAHGV